VSTTGMPFCTTSNLKMARNLKKRVRGRFRSENIEIKKEKLGF